MSFREKRAGFHSPNWPPFPSKPVEPHYYLGTRRHFSSNNIVGRANLTKGDSMRGIVLALRAKISACVITRSREECKEHGDDHYDLGTGDNSILLGSGDAGIAPTEGPRPPTAKPGTLTQSTTTTTREPDSVHHLEPHRHRSDHSLVFSLLPWDGGFYDRWCPRKATHARHAPRPQANIPVHVLI